MSTDLATAQMSDPDEPNSPSGSNIPVGPFIPAQSYGPPLSGPDAGTFLPVSAPPTATMPGLPAQPFTGPFAGSYGGSSAGPTGSAPVGGSFIGPIAGPPGGRTGEATVALPESLQWLLEVLVGERWPAAIESDLHAVADVWRHLGGQVREAHRAVEPAAGAVIQYNQGPGVRAFGEFWRAFSARPMPQAVSVCGELEAMLRQFAGDVAGTKTYIIVQLEVLAGEVALGMAGSGLTLGVSDAVATAAAAATRALIRDALGELATKTAATAARMTAKASATELLNDGTLQTLQQLNGGHSFNLGQWTHAGAIGAVGGLVGGPVGQHVEALGRPSLVHSALTEGADQLGENAAKQLTEAATADQNGESPDPAENVSLIARDSALGAVTHHAHTHHHEEFLPAASTHTSSHAGPVTGTDTGRPAQSVPAARTAPEQPAAGAYQPGQIARALAGEN